MSHPAQSAFPFGSETIPPARARTTNPETSKAAAASFSEQRLTEIQQAVFDWFNGRGHLGGTDVELENALLEKYPAPSTLRKRRCDLVERGFLEAATDKQGKPITRRPTGRRTPLQVWRTKERG